MSILVSCAAKEPYYIDGKKFRVFAEVTDEYSIDSFQFLAHKFEPNKLKDSTIQYILGSDVNDYLEKIEGGKMLLIITYSNCKGADDDAIIAKFAEQNNIPCIFVSTYNNPKRMFDLNRKYDLDNKASLIIPTGKLKTTFYSHRLLKKKD